MLKKFLEYTIISEKFEYTVSPNDINDGDGVEADVLSGNSEFADEHMTRSSVDRYIDQIERATKETVVGVSGESDETDSDLTFKISDSNTINIHHIYHPHNSKILISIRNGNNTWEKSYITNSDNNNFDYSGEDGEHDMIKDIYTENGLIEEEYDEPTHEIKLPQELFGNDPYFSYDSDERNDQKMVSFESEEAAQMWIDSLKITVIKN